MNNRRHPIVESLLVMVRQLANQGENCAHDAGQVLDAVVANIAICEDADVSQIVIELCSSNEGAIATRLLVIHGNYKKRTASREDSVTDFEGMEGRPN